jgi:hypothetical protein
MPKVDRHRGCARSDEGKEVVDGRHKAGHDDIGAMAEEPTTKERSAIVGFPAKTL